MRCGFGFIALGFIISQSLYCEAACEPPPAPTNGALVPAKASYQHGERFRYKCNDGYQLVGISVKVCISSFYIPSSTPRCDDVNECLTGSPCGDNAECTNINGSFTCTCFDGYSKEGISGCVKIIGCPDIRPENGDLLVLGSFRSGSPPFLPSTQVAITCNIPYRLDISAVTSPLLTCQSNGEWDGVPARCIGTCSHICLRIPGVRLPPLPVGMIQPCGCDRTCRRNNSCCSDYREDLCNDNHGAAPCPRCPEIDDEERPEACPICPRRNCFKCLGNDRRCPPCPPDFCPPCRFPTACSACPSNRCPICSPKRPLPPPRNACPPCPGHCRVCPTLQEFCAECGIPHIRCFCPNRCPPCLFGPGRCDPHCSKRKHRPKCPPCN